MPRIAKEKAPNAPSTTTIGFEAKLWLTADSRSAAETAAGNRSNNMDPAEPSGARQPAKGSPKGERAGVHQFGVPPKGNANFAWVQHFIHHLAPGGAGTAGGMAGFVLANGSMSSNQSGECVARSASSKPEAKLHGLGRQRGIRRALIEADLVDCMVAVSGTPKRLSCDVRN